MQKTDFLTASAAKEAGVARLSTEICGVDPISDPRVEKFVVQNAGATVFHTSAWAKVLKATYGFQPNYLVMGRNNLQAMLPLTEVNSWLTGRRGVSLPFTDECGVLAEDEAGAKELISRAIEMGRTRKWKYLELRTPSKHLSQNVPSVSFLGHEIDLGIGAKNLFETMESSMRRSVRKAEKSGVTIEFSTELPAIKEFYALLCLTRRRHGMPPQPFAFFRNIQALLLSKGMGFVALARHEGQAVAGAVYLTHGSKAIYKFGASDETKQELRGNNLVMWRSMEKLAAEGFQNLQLGRTSLSNEGLRRSNSVWGRKNRRSTILSTILARANLSPTVMKRWAGITEFSNTCRSDWRVWREQFCTGIGHEDFK